MILAERVMGIEESATLAITSRAKRLAKDGVEVVSFAAGEPDFDTPDYVKDAAVKAIKEGFTKYTPSSGMPELKDAICRKLISDNALEYSPSQIVVSNGAKHSLFNIFQAVCAKGDEVLIPAPFWLSYPPMVHFSGATSVIVPTYKERNFKLTPEALKSKITKNTKCLILNSPSNPTGCIYKKEDLEVIAKIAVAHDILVVSDEIYEKLVYDGLRHVSIASLGKEIFARTVVVNGLSKSHSMTGWRIGYAAGPSEVMAAISNIQSHAASNPCSISQRAALAALTGDDSFVRTMRDEFEKRRDFMLLRLNSMKGLSAVKPEGAFYIMCGISSFGMGSIEFANRLLDEAAVALIPGQPFGADDFVRLSFATSLEKIKRGMDKIEKWIKDNG